MRFFNIDFHISVVADIRSLWTELGHQVDSLNLSSHNWVFGRKRDRLPSLDGMSFTDFGQRECDRFFDAEEKRLDGYDGFLVTHTPCLAALYEPTGKPVICVVSTRYDGFCQTAGARAWLDDKLVAMHRSGQLRLVVNNAYDAWHVWHHLGIRPPVISSICDYTGVAWRGGGTAPFLAGRSEVPGLRRLPRGHSWQDVADAAAVVTIPYNVSLMSVFERHSMGMPMLMPSGSWTLLHKETLSELSYAGKPDSGELEMAVVLSDWHGEALPGISFFDSLQEIPIMLREGLPPTTGQRPRKEQALDQWRDLARELDPNTRRRSRQKRADPLPGRWRWHLGSTGELHPSGALAQVDSDNLRHRFGSWQTVPGGFELVLEGGCKKRIVLTTPESGHWYLEGDGGPGGFIRKLQGAGPPAGCRRTTLSCDSYANRADSGTAVIHTDSAGDWYRRMRPSVPYTLITCHSDTPVDARFCPILDDPLLLRWYAVNASISHPKLVPVPLGVCHRPMLDRWLWESDTTLTPLLYDLLLAEGSNAPKTKCFNVSFNSWTNPRQRQDCAQSTGLASVRLPQPQFLIDLASSRYCLAPEGNGMDSHRVWEALYCRTVPVITWNPMVPMGLYDGLPVVVLDSWREFRTGDFTVERHERLMKDFDPASITLDRWIPNISSTGGDDSSTATFIP